MPAFEGYSHHDSQEFLSQLLDTCHEDTNQILKKPYTQTPTLHPGLKTDTEMGRDSWILHLKRNNSFFIHNFFGQFRSEIKCPLCNSIYLKYDCFQVISLPIPSKRKNSMDFFFISNDQKFNKALKNQFSAVSYSNFNDVTIKELRKEVLSKDDIVSSDSLLRIGLMGFEENSILLYDHRTIADVFLYDEQRCCPKMFVFELVDYDRDVLTNNATRILKNDISKEEKVELKGGQIEEKVIIENSNNLEYLKTRKDIIFVLFKSTLDYFDTELPIYEDINELKPRYRRVKEFPLFTKAFYVTKKHRIIDLYWRVFQKFEFKSKVKSESDVYNSDDSDDNKIQEETQNDDLRIRFSNLMQNDEMFFYIRINGVFYGEDHWFKKLDSFNGEYMKEGEENTLHIDVYFREGERKKCKGEKNIPKVDFEHFTSCYYKNYLDFDISSPDFEELTESKYTLKGLMNKFSEPETLDNQNMYRCSKCKVEVKAQIKMEVQKVPRVLVIFFKRIKKGYHSDSPEITYPEFLDMKPYVNDKTPMESYNVQAKEILDDKNIELYKEKMKDLKNKIKEENSDTSDEDDVFNSQAINENTNPLEMIYLPDPNVKTDLKYELFGVVNHYGSQNFGHYTSLVKTSKGWVDFNDERASKADMDSVINKNAYMLFYMRKDDKN